MKQSLKPGTKPLISQETIDLLSDHDDEDITVCTNEFDRIISETNLQIKHFGFLRDLDVAVFILNNSKIIQRKLSDYPLLESALDYDLYQYQVSEYGIHWPDIDADLSLRGFLMEEALKLAMSKT
jgi:hypothetical protein